jgi:hypothetical protein
MRAVYAEELLVPGFDLAVVAATVARTPDAPVPAVDRSLG